MRSPEARVPQTLVLIRHATSAANAADDVARRIFPDDPNLAARFIEAHLRRRYPDVFERSDWPLTPKGTTEARRLRGYLRSRFRDGFDAYYTSALTRARQTFAIALPGILPDIHSPLLNEFLGHTDEDFRRVQQFFALLSAKHAGERVLCVGHGNWIRSVIDVPPAGVAVDPMVHAPDLSQPVLNTSVTIFTAKHLSSGETRLVLTEYNTVPQEKP